MNCAKNGSAKVALKLIAPASSFEYFALTSSSPLSPIGMTSRGVTPYSLK